MLPASVDLKAGKQTGPLQIQCRERNTGIDDNIQNQVSAAIIQPPASNTACLILEKDWAKPKGRIWSFSPRLSLVLIHSTREAELSRQAVLDSPAFLGWSSTLRYHLCFLPMS